MRGACRSHASQTARCACLFSVLCSRLGLKKYYGAGRYRSRHLDLVINPGVRSVFVRRSAILRSLRTFFDSRGFIEVPVNIEPFMPSHSILRLSLPWSYHFPRKFKERTLVLARTIDCPDPETQVETPMLAREACGAQARPFTTFHNDMKSEMFMRIAVGPRCYPPENSLRT